MHLVHAHAHKKRKYLKKKKKNNNQLLQKKKIGTKTKSPFQFAHIFEIRTKALSVRDDNTTMFGAGEMHRQRVNPNSPTFRHAALTKMKELT